MTDHVRFGSKADIAECEINVRFTASRYSPQSAAPMPDEGAALN